MYMYIYINLSWPWISPRRGWGSLTMPLTGTFLYIPDHFILLCINPFYLVLIVRDGCLSTHSCRFACQQRVLKTFPGPLQGWGIQTMTLTGKFLDETELYELVGFYLLNVLKSMFRRKNIGLYGEDSLSSFENKSEPELEKIRKKIYKIFKDNGLNITTETNLHITEYLDVTFNLKTGKYYPYRKQNNNLQYVHKQFNHLPSTIKRILSIISKRLSDISRDKEHFEKAAPIYNEAPKIVVLMKH